MMRRNKQFISESTMLKIGNDLTGLIFGFFNDQQLKHLSPVCGKWNQLANQLVTNRFKLEYIKKNHLTAKGMKLILAYYAKKKAQGQILLYIENEQDFISSLAKFAESKENSLLLIYDNGTHRCACRCEKTNDKLYVIVVDSCGEVQGNLNTILKKLIMDTQLNKKLVYFHNQTIQQSDSENCSYFSLKNLHTLAATNDFAIELLTKKNVIEEEQFSGIVKYRYYLPVRFMYLTQSYDNLQKYIEQHPDIDKRVLRVNKEGKSQTLREYAAHTRDNYGVKTPIAIKNKHAEDDMIFKNNSILYFKMKYINKIVPTFFKTYTVDQLNKMLEAHTPNKDSLKL